MFTGNRGCLVDNGGNIVRHHQGSLWIICSLEYRDWRSPLTAPRRWTPLFFLDEVVALAAGHRPCGLCRRESYREYQAAVAKAMKTSSLPNATDMNRMLASERLTPGRGPQGRRDRRTWKAHTSELPSGAVVVGDEGVPTMIRDGMGYRFDFNGWIRHEPLPERQVDVLTPPTSVAALRAGFHPESHESAGS